MNTMTLKEEKKLRKKIKREFILKELKGKKQLYFMMAPFLVLFFTFTVLPVMISIILSFTNFDMAQMPKFNGFENYIFMLFRMMSFR